MEFTTTAATAHLLDGNNFFAIHCNLLCKDVLSVACFLCFHVTALC